MAHKQLSGRQKAFALVPIALLSGAWTLSLTSGSAATAVADKSGVNGTLPDGTTVPDQAIEAPANVPVAGAIAPGVPQGDADQVVDGSTTSGIPSAALSAYQRAAQIINSADKSCNIPWQLIAAIGRVESDHGRYGGNVLSPKGVSTPGIYGPELDGKNGTQAIKDTDAGDLDKDKVFDRAVGPMQFIPSTWQVVKVDADGDGIRNPQDIDDASLATAVYLCSGDENLAKEAGQKSSVYRYNHSEQYVDLVLRIMQAYESGDYTAVPNSISGGNLFSLSDSGALTSARGHALAKQKKQKKQRQLKIQQLKVDPSPSPSSTPTSPGGSDKSSSGKGGITTSGGSSGGLPNVTKDPVKTVTKDLPKVTKPTTDLLSHTAAAAICQTQIDKILDPFKKIPSNASDLCADKAVDAKAKTADDVAALVPNTLLGLLSFLGL